MVLVIIYLTLYQGIIYEQIMDKYFKQGTILILNGDIW